MWALSMYPIAAAVLLAALLNDPFAVIGLALLLLVSIVDIYFDVLYRRLGAWLLKRITSGRLPSGEPSRRENLFTALAGFIAVVGGLGLIFLLTFPGAA